MPCPHNEITIVQRSQRQSAVAAAAYQSGEKLFCEYDQQVKHYPEKRGIVHNEILLPANALPEYADRNTLWNAAEAVEKQWNSQLARRWVLTIPREIPPDQYAVLVREFCQQQFVSKGMIADFAIHDPHPPGHNPHAHVLLTMRAMDEHGKWLPKSRKVYDLDENGERIKLPSGRWKSHKEDTGLLRRQGQRGLLRAVPACTHPTGGHPPPDHSGRSGNHLSRSESVSSTGVGGYCLRFPQTPLPRKTHQYVELDCPEGLAPHPETAVLLPSSKRERRAAPGGGAGRPGRGESKQEGLRRGGAAGQQSQRGPTL